MIAKRAAAEIKIGLTPSLTGPLSWSGQLTKTSMEWAVAGLNAAGGVFGEGMRIVPVDEVRPVAVKSSNIEWRS